MSSLDGRLVSYITTGGDPPLLGSIMQKVPHGIEPMEALFEPKLMKTEGSAAIRKKAYQLVQQLRPGETSTPPDE